MKKTYLKPEIECLEIRENLPLLENTVTLPVGDGGTSGTPDSNDDVSEFEDLLSKPTTIYVAWDDDDFDI